MTAQSDAPLPPAHRAASAGAAVREDRPAPPGRRGQVVEHPAAQDARIARIAALRPRHRAVLGSFLVAVVAPTLLAAGYLYGFAADQYESRLAFSIRSSETVASSDLLGALSSTIGGGGPDAEILFEFIRSQQMVNAAVEALPLGAMYNRPENDPVFSLGDEQPVEEVVDYWNWMTDVSYDGGTGIVNFRARAFTPDDAQAIAEVVLDESTDLVNELSHQAREDAVSVAREVLAEAEDRLRAVRREMRAFRDLEQELDPTMNAQAALSLVAGLEQELALTRVELDSQLQLVGERSPRIVVLRQKIDSLEKQIAEERQRIGAGAPVEGETPGRALADLLAEYEDLEVDREFAENAYVSALAAYEQAQVEARRQARYLSPHIRPTLAMQSRHPQRELLTAAAFGTLLVVWAVTTLILYNIRDRR